MASYSVAPLQKLIEQFEKLPGIGAKTAQRLAYFVLNLPKTEAEEFAKAIVDAKEKIKYCTVCCNFTDKEFCNICDSKERDSSIICVVEDPKDISAIERTQEFNAVYHVLHGAISPMLGIGPADIKLKELMQRMQEDVDEVIIATNSSLEGETTAMYISKLIKPTGIKVSRIASGVPVGGDLEYIDEVTLLRALEGRVDL